MSCSVFKEYPSETADSSPELDEAVVAGFYDNAQPGLDSNMVVFLNKDGSVTVDQSALHNLLVNDATDTNTSISVIRVGSPTPSLQMELDAEEEMEREMLRMHAETDTGKERVAAGSDAEADENEENEDDDESDYDDDDDDDEDDAEDDDEDADENDDVDEPKGDDKNPDDEKENSDATNRKRTKGSRNRKASNSRRAARKVPVKVPQVSLMVENYYSPAEAKQLASQVLSIAGITNPLQITVDFEYQRYTIANDHSYTTYLSLNELAAVMAQAQNTPAESKSHMKNSRTKLRIPTMDIDTIELSDDSDAPIIRSQSARKHSEVEDEAAEGSHEEDEEAYDDSDQSYVSPSESDRDSDLDFNVNHRSTTRSRKLVNRSKLSAIQQKQLQKQQQPQNEHGTTKTTYSKKRQTGIAAADPIAIGDDENVKRKITSTLKVSKKLVTTATDAIVAPSSPAPTKTLVTTAAMSSVPNAVPNTIKATVKLPNVNTNSITSSASIRQPIQISPAVTTVQRTVQPIRNIVSTTIQRTIPNRMIVVRKDGSGSTVISTMATTSATGVQGNLFTMNRKPQPNCTVMPIVSYAGNITSSNSPRFVQAPKRSDTSLATSPPFVSPVVAKKARLDGTALFSTPDIIKKIGSNSLNNSMNVSTSTANPPTTSITKPTISLPANNRVTNISVITLPPVTLTPLTISNTMPMNNRTMIIKSASAISRSLQPTTMQAQPLQHHPLPTPPTPAPTNNASVSQQPPYRRYINIQSVSSASATAVRNAAPINSTANVIFKKLPTALQNNWQLQQQPKVVLYSQATNQLLQLQEQSSIVSPPPSSVVTQPIVIDPLPTPPPSSSIQNAHNMPHIAPSFMNITTDASLLPDVDLLDGLVNSDDGLSEDLLQHVAKLAEDKNLQQVIDQQVLGVQMAASQTQHLQLNKSTFGTFAPASIVASLPQTLLQTTPTNNAVKLMKAPCSTVISAATSNFHSTEPPTAAQSSSVAPAQITAISAATATPAKEPITIVRSDGRVITLPPIEAPTTRGAKRRAQIGNSSSNNISSTAASPAPSVIANASPALSTPGTPALSVVMPSGIGNASTPKSRRASAMPERRPSLAIRKSTTTAINKANKVTTPAVFTPSPAIVSTIVPSNTSSAATTANALNDTNDDSVIINLTEDDDDDEEGASDGSYNSEDDPYRLWCICRQPHNNRFMICCDKCEDWFHGKCVSVTKAMGTKMDEQGIEWVCPNCLAKHPHLQQRQQAVLSRKSLGAATPVASRKASTASTSSSVSASVSMIEQPVVGNSASIVIAMPMTTQEVTHTSTVPPKNKTTVRSSAIETITNPAPSTQNPTTASERVDVFERKTGRVLTGNAAPTVAELKRWLHEHPTFQVVNPGSAHALAIQAKRQQLKQLAHDMNKMKETTATAQSPQRPHTPQKIQSTLRIGPCKKIQLINPQTQAPHSPSASNVATSTTSSVRPTTPLAGQTVRQTNTSAPATTVASRPATNAPPPPKTKTGATAGRGHQTEPVRQNVVRTLKEQLTVRMRELPADDPTDHPKLSADEIEHFVNATEREIYLLFGRDTGMKYRAKYRSVMFNLTDRKNATLFRKICERSCGAADLVRMTAEEMASQELAEWREKEAKHQLEIIKKSELDLMACAKTYVLKTLRGEEVIEMATAASDADAVAIEAVLSANPQPRGSTNAAVSSTTSETVPLLAGVGELISIDSAAVGTKDMRFERSISAALEAKSPSAALAPGIGNSNSNTPIATTIKKATSSTSTSKRTRSRSRDDDYTTDSRSRSSTSSSKYSRRRSRNREIAISDRSNRDKDNTKQHSRPSASSSSKSSERSTKDKEKEPRDKYREKSKDKDKNHKDAASSGGTQTTKQKESGNISSSSNSSNSTRTPSKVETPTKSPHVGESVDIIEKIMKAQSVIDSVLRPNAADTSTNSSHDTTDLNSTTDLPITSTGPNNPVKTTHTSTIAKTDNKSSTNAEHNVASLPAMAETNVKLQSPLWTGSIFMVDVATFQISVCPVLGDVASLPGELPIELEIVGRIRAEQVWDYVRKLRKSHSNEVRLVRFSSGTSDDCDAYYTLYDYMLKRKRYGVIKPKVPFVKDFYIFPLESHGTLPAELPQKGGEFEDDRPNLLMGVIVINRLSSAKHHRSVNVAVASSSSAPLAAIKTSASGVGSISNSNTMNSGSHTVGRVSATKSNAETRYTPPPVSPTMRQALKSGTATAVSPNVSSVTISKEIITVLDDGDEPYSPGGGSDNEIDDNLPAVLQPIAFTSNNNAASTISFPQLVPPDNQSISIPGLDAVPTTSHSDESPALNPTEIQRKVEELTRQIEEQKMEIAGILHGAAAGPATLDGLDEPYSPSSILDDQCSNDPNLARSTVKSALDNIAIPSNLQEILNSIKSSSIGVLQATQSNNHEQQHLQLQQQQQQMMQSSMLSYTTASQEEYDPISVSTNIANRTPYGTQIMSTSYVGAAAAVPSKGVSKLAQLTDEELMSMVPDDIRDSIVQPARHQAPMRYHAGQNANDNEYNP